MKISKLALCVLLVISCFAMPALALTDAEYKKMMRDPAFADADNELGMTWKDINEDLKKPVKSALLKDQRAWLKSGRDAVAKSFMQAGYDRTEAYTMATRARVDELYALVGKYSLMASPDGMQGYYVRMNGKKETAWLEINRADSEDPDSADFYACASTSGVPSYNHEADFRAGGLLIGKNTVEFEEELTGAIMTVTYKNNGKTAIVTTNERFKENWGDMEGTYTLQKL